MTGKTEFYIEEKSIFHYEVKEVGTHKTVASSNFSLEAREIVEERLNGSVVELPNESDSFVSY